MLRSKVVSLHALRPACPNMPPPPGGSSDGDPHIRLYDGRGYDCHGQGEFVFTEAAATDSEVQVRFQQWSQNPDPAVTVTTGVAAREGGSSLVQVTPAASGGLEVLVDGDPHDAAVTGTVTGVALEVTTTRVEMRFPSGLDVFVSTGNVGILSVNAYVPITLATTGLLGNNNGVMGDDWTVRAPVDDVSLLNPNPEQRVGLIIFPPLLTQGACCALFARSFDDAVFFSSPYIPCPPASLCETAIR